MRLFAILLSGVAGILSLAAQTPPTPAATPMNMLGNPSFDNGFRRDNLWDGVDSSGSLAGERGVLPVLTTSGTIASTAMPISVSIADMNGDQLPDIGMMDPVGYFRIFFNQGSKTEPKFEVGELSSIFLSRVDPADPTLQGVSAKHARMGQRIHLTDMTRSNKNDLVIGNYLGEIMLLLNGSGVKPDFKQPSSIAQVIIPTMKDSLKKWGNVFAPATWDWNRDGKDDLLVGEGSYSANSIHLLLNQGSGTKPVFDENNRSVLAYGMGLEQLTPCVVDYNGDGALDLLVTERTGKVAVYLNSGKPWKPGDTLPFDSFIAVGGAKPAAGNATVAKDPLTAATAPGLLTVGGIATIAAADMNGDGLFDLVFGKSNGKVMMSLNTGSKTEPKFGAPTEVKGTAGTPPFNSPSGWECDFGIDRGNFYGYFSVVKKDDDPEAKTTDGKPCLKAGYTPSPNKCMPVPTHFTPAFKTWKPGSGKVLTKVADAPANYFELKQDGSRALENNKTYQFSMKVKGAKVTDAAVEISMYGTKKLSAAKLERGTRDAVKKIENEVKETIKQIFRFNPGSTWTDVKGEFSVKFADKDLADDPLDGRGPKDDPHGSLSWTTTVVFALAPGSGEIYFDDFKIIKKP